MHPLHAPLVFLHVLSVSLWMAAALWVSGDVSRALSLGRPYVDGLAARIRPKLGLDAAAGIATITTGGLLMWEGSMSHPRLGVVAGMVLAFARLGLLAAMRRSWRSIAARLERGERVEVRDPAARRMSMLSGIAHALWMLALAGMVFPI